MRLDRGMDWRSAHVFDELEQCVRLAHDVLRQGGGYGTRVPGQQRSVGEMLATVLEHADRIRRDFDRKVA